MINLLYVWEYINAKKHKLNLNIQNDAIIFDLICL